MLSDGLVINDRMDRYKGYEDTMATFEESVTPEGNEKTSLGLKV